MKTFNKNDIDVDTSKIEIGEINEFIDENGHKTYLKMIIKYGVPVEIDCLNCYFFLNYITCKDYIDRCDIECYFIEDIKMIRKQKLNKLKLL